VEAAGDGTPPILRLLERLDFPKARPTLLHAVTPVTADGWHLSPLLGIEEARHREQRALAQAERRLSELLPDARHRVMVGKPAAVLLDEATKSDAPLVAVNASNRGTLETLLTGSVARAVASAAPQSVLLARPSEKTGPLHAVLATDHSDYAAQCLETLIGLAPRGIGRLSVLTAFPESYSDEIAEAALGTAVHEMTRRCHAVEQHLQGRIGTPETVFESHVVAGKARTVLNDFMEQSGADLLILGAKGHSLIERLTLGSVSFDQAVGSYPWAVLILRA
jgi:nucleotide-binding universal stress UspA family protein